MAGRSLLVQSTIFPKAASLPRTRIAREFLTLRIIAFPDAKCVEKEQKLERAVLGGEAEPHVSVRRHTDR